jgi:hypothetical protein
VKIEAGLGKAGLLSSILLDICVIVDELLGFGYRLLLMPDAICKAATLSEVIVYLIGPHPLSEF